MRIILKIQRLLQDYSDHTVYRLVTQTLTYGIGVFVSAILNFILLTVYTHFLSPQNYGVISILTVTKTMLATIILCGLTNGILRYFYYAEREYSCVEEIVWSPIIFTTVISILSLVSLGMYSSSISSFLLGSQNYRYLILLTLIDTFAGNIINIGITILIIQEKALVVVVVNILKLFLGILNGYILVVYLGRGLQGAIEAFLITSVIMMVVIAMVSFLRMKPALSFIMLKKQLKFSLPLVITILAFSIIDYSDRYILKIFLPLSEVGLYDVGYNFGMIMTILAGGFSSAWPPYYYNNNKDGNNQAICNAAIKLYLPIAAVCALALSFFSPFILRLFTSEQFYQARTIIPWVAAAYMFKGPYLIFAIGLLVKNKVWWQVRLEIGAALINLALNFALIPMMGREGAALATLMTYTFMCVGAYILVMRINPIPNPPKRFILEISLLTIFVTGVLTYLSKNNLETFQISITTAFVALVFLSLIILSSRREMLSSLTKH